jgi:hypothetical protein
MDDRGTESNWSWARRHGSEMEREAQHETKALIEKDRNEKWGLFLLMFLFRRRYMLTRKRGWIDLYGASRLNIVQSMQSSTDENGDRTRLLI